MSELAFELPDELTIKAKAKLVEKLVGLPVGQRRPVVAKVFRGLEAMSVKGIQEHMAGSLTVISDSKERFNTKAMEALEREFAQDSAVLEADLLTRINGFRYRDALLAKYRDLRAAEWQEAKTAFKASLEGATRDLRNQIHKLHDTCFPLRDLRKVLTEKALMAWDEPVPEAALSAVFEEWDHALQEMHALLIKTLKEMFEHSKAAAKAHET